MTLRRRLLLILLLIAVAPMAAVGTFVTWEAFRLAERRGQEVLAGQLDSVSALIDQALAAERSAVASWVAEWTARQPGTRRVGLDEWLLGWMRPLCRQGRLLPSLSRVVLLEAGRSDAFVIEGRVTADELTVAGSRIPVTALPEAYRRRLEDPTDATDRVTVSLPGGPVVALYVGLPAPAATAPALLVEELAVVPFMEQLLARPAHGGLAHAFVVAPERPGGGSSFLFHTDLVSIGLPAPATARADRSAAPGALPADGARWAFVRRGDALEATGRHVTTGWRLGGSISLAPHLAPLRQSIRVLLPLFALTVLLVVAGILLETRGIGRVVEEIAATSGAIARGDFDRALRVRRSDEFGAIAEHVNQMARDLVVTAESRSIARLGARLVHDLKGIASQLSLMAYDLEERYDDPRFRADVVAIMQDLVGQVESLALKLRRGREGGEPEWQTLDLDAIVDALLRRRVESAWPAIAVGRELRSPGPVVANRELVEEAVENVLVNAGEAMDGRGALRVRTGAAAPGTGAGEPTHFVEVEDDGPGMSREFVERELFRPFTTTKAKGLGLGMYCTRQAVTRLAGRIDVASLPGRGTRVRIEIGRAPGRLEASARRRDAP